MFGECCEVRQRSRLTGPGVGRRGNQRRGDVTALSELPQRRDGGGGVVRADTDDQRSSVCLAGGRTDADHGLLLLGGQGGRLSGGAQGNESASSAD